jgi:replicative DNA helicase Mcm
MPIKCSNPTCERTGPFTLVEEESEYLNLQELWIQESTEELPPGQLPRTVHVKAIGEIVNIARPGDNVSVVGIVRALPQKIKGGQLTTFNTFIEANSIKVLGKEPETIPNIEDINRIIELSKDPWIHKKIINSIAPSIYGYDHVKEAIMYLLFGGVPKEKEDIKIRGELNILLIGDPGTAKSQLLRYVSKLAPRGLYTSGKGVSGVGLTATCIKDVEAGGEWTLVAGALVLADKGVICIDEMDKMSQTDRENIHEPLEQHTISIAKGGIVATLNARTAVLAAANPALGRYNPYSSIVENIALPVTLLSRFDLIFLMLDVPNVDADSKLAKHILKLHRGATNSPPIPADLLRKYITYAKQINPVLTEEAAERIEQFYLSLRAKSVDTSLAIGPRQLEAITRIAEARARAALRKEATIEDAEAAINIMNQSLQQVGVDTTSGKIDIDIIMTGKPKTMRDKLGTVVKLIVELEKETGLVEKDYLLKELEKTYGIHETDAEKFITQLLREGTIFEPREGFLKKT